MLYAFVGSLPIYTFVMQTRCSAFQAERDNPRSYPDDPANRRWMIANSQRMRIAGAFAILAAPTIAAAMSHVASKSGNSISERDRITHKVEITHKTLRDALACPAVNKGCVDINSRTREFIKSLRLVARTVLPKHALATFQHLISPGIRTAWVTGAVACSFC